MGPIKTGSLHRFNAVELHCNCLQPADQEEFCCPLKLMFLYIKTVNDTDTFPDRLFFCPTSSTPSLTFISPQTFCQTLHRLISISSWWRPVPRRRLFLVYCCFGFGDDLKAAASMRIQSAISSLALSTASLTTWLD